ncbi:MAG: hypothetical protein AAF493_00925 [Pseudomonadota bacterium]
MRPYSVSKSTAAALKELAQKRPTVLTQIRRQPSARQRDLLERIRHADELGSVPGLSNYLAASRPIADLAADALESLLAGRAPHQLEKLDAQCRRYSQYSPSIWSWASLKPQALQAVRSRCHLLGLFSFHPSGWVREAALDALDSLEDPAAITYLLLRANDWVVPVRTRATDAIRRRFDAKHVDALIGNLTIIHRFADKERTDLSALLVEIRRILLAQPAKLKAALVSTDFRLRRAVFDITWRSDHRERLAFVEWGLADPDPFIRLKAAQRGSESNLPDLRATIRTRLLNDTWSALRLIGLRIAIADDDDRTTPDVRNRVVDRSRAIRHAARFYMQENRLVDDSETFASFYRDAIDHGDRLAGLRGLAECGTADDLDAPTPYLNDKRARIADAALNAVNALSAATPLALLMNQVAHIHPRCSKTAARLLADDLTEEVIARAHDLLMDEHSLAHVRLNALRLLMEQSKWRRLQSILRATSVADAQVRSAGQHYLTTWHRAFNRSFIQPTQQDLAALESALRGANLSPDEQTLLSTMIPVSD